jgi:hypothetical protein
LGTPFICAALLLSATALGQDTYTVMSKVRIPPSGSKHDYMSQDPDSWYDQAKYGGIPYIRRDGEHNPEADKITDYASLTQMIDEVVTLVDQGDDESTKRASLLLRTWFLDPATRMNPNLAFAHYIPGLTNGSGTGIIETAGFTRLLPAVEKLKECKAWTHKDRIGLDLWFNQYLQWLQESPNGKEAAALKNNDGSWYDAQIAAIALFTDRKDLAQRVISQARVKDLARQIEPDGRQPMELERTNGFTCSVRNLEALFTLASLGDQVGVDLWNYRTSDGRRLRKAVDWLMPFATGDKKWEHDQIVSANMDSFKRLLMKASEVYHNLEYKAAADHLITLKAAR